MVPHVMIIGRFSAEQLCLVMYPVRLGGKHTGVGVFHYYPYQLMIPIARREHRIVVEETGPIIVTK